MQFGIFVFVEAQETNLQDNFQGCKCDGDCIVLWKHFSFYEKVPSSLDLVGYFWKIFTPASGVMFSTDLHYSICSI